MLSNIEIERIWQDDDFFEISITCTSKIIKASTEVYVTDSAINNLQNEIYNFLDFRQSEVFWKSGERGNHSTPCVEFYISMKDFSGHILIEVFMELNDGGNLDKHNCCFYLETELGLLHTFNDKISQLKRYELGTKISLLSEDVQ